MIRHLLGNYITPSLLQYYIFSLKICQLSVYAVMTSSTSNRKKRDDQGFFHLLPWWIMHLRSIGKAFRFLCTSITLTLSSLNQLWTSNLKLKSLPNFDISGFGKPEFKFKVRVLKTFVKQASGHSPLLCPHWRLHTELSGTVVNCFSGWWNCNILLCGKTWGWWQTRKLIQQCLYSSFKKTESLFLFTPTLHLFEHSSASISSRVFPLVSGSTKKKKVPATDASAP